MLPRSLKTLIEPPKGLRVDFASPAGAQALVPFDGVSWRIFANPLCVFIGGVAAVILELAEPSVRAGVWEHSSFRRDPVMRLRRTGFAALITVYAPRPEAEAMIARVVAMHERVNGVTADGLPYRANDPRLLTWVHATALWGFTQAFHCYGTPLTMQEKNAAFLEGREAARLYGADAPPRNWQEWEALLALTPLQDSPVITEFLDLMEQTPILPGPLRALQRGLVRAAVDMVPAPVRAFQSLRSRGMRRGEAGALRLMGKLAGALPLPQLPPAQARRRFAAL